MVTQYGMSQKLGPIYLSTGKEVFLGRDFSQTHAEFSEQVAAEVDTEVRGLLNAGYERARSILTEHRESLDKLAVVLLEREKIGEAEFLEIMQGQTVHAPTDEAETVAPEV